ncbi:hypothetical protein ACO0LC_09700 [Undibacterium sp. JH2W]|uniref:hypothetical protein n=1 Tax=Undibacterium sp. JH2W TaxID=3413037 RepID=UPI003BF270E6
MANFQRIFGDDGLPYLIDASRVGTNESNSPWSIGSDDLELRSEPPPFARGIDMDFGYGQDMARFREDTASRLGSMGASSDLTDLTRSNFLRAEKADYQNDDLDRRYVSRTGDTMAALFKKEFGYTPSSGELIPFANMNEIANSRLLQIKKNDASNFLTPDLSFDKFCISPRPIQSRGLLNRYEENSDENDFSGKKPQWASTSDSDGMSDMDDRNLYGNLELGSDSADSWATPDANAPFQNGVVLDKQSGRRNLLPSYNPAELQKAGYKRNAIFFQSPEDQDGHVIRSIADVHNFEREQARARLAHDLDTSIPKKSINDYQTSIGLRKYAQDMYVQGNMQEAYAANRRIIALQNERTSDALKSAFPGIPKEDADMFGGMIFSEPQMVQAPVGYGQATNYADTLRKNGGITNTPNATGFHKSIVPGFKEFVGPMTKTDFKILFGEAKPGTNQIIGGHSPDVLKSPLYTMNSNKVINPDDTISVDKFKGPVVRKDGTYALSAGKSPNIHTIAPPDWNNVEVLRAGQLTANAPGILLRDVSGVKTTLHTGYYRGVQWQVIKDNGVVTSSFPAGTRPIVPTVP